MHSSTIKVTKFNSNLSKRTKLWHHSCGIYWVSEWLGKQCVWFHSREFKSIMIVPMNMPCLGWYWADIGAMLASDGPSYDIKCPWSHKLMTELESVQCGQTCQNWAVISPMLSASGWFWPSSGMLWHVYKGWYGEEEKPGVLSTLLQVTAHLMHWWDRAV